MSAEARYRLLNLSQLDVRRLKAMEGVDAFVVEEPRADAHRHNELATVALMGGVALLSMAAAYYFGKSDKEEIILKVEEIAADGSVRLIDLKINRKSNEPIENQVLKALTRVPQAGA